MIVYIEISVDSTRKLLDLISEFGKIVGYKICSVIDGILVHQQ